jgi:hypothetical protein
MARESEARMTGSLRSSLLTGKTSESALGGGVTSSKWTELELKRPKGRCRALVLSRAEDVLKQSHDMNGLGL